MKEKGDAGGDHLIAQFFFDNNFSMTSRNDVRRLESVYLWGHASYS
ncbi:hypothetical protein [Aerococcus christensenii]